MSRRPAVLVPAGLLLAALVVSCQADPPRSAPAGTGAAPSTGASPTGASPTATGPAGTSQAAYRTVPPPDEQPGRLVDSTPTGPAAWVARLWFGGALIGRDGAKLLVAYTAVELGSDGTRTVAHAKLSVFRCASRQGAGSPNFVGCTGRRVEYGDLDQPRLRVSRTGTGAFSVTGTVPTYSYGAGVDRGAGLPMRWTGRAFPVRVSCVPDPQPVCRPGRRGGSAAVVLGAGAVAGRAGLDFGYLNRLSR